MRVGKLVLEKHFVLRNLIATEYVLLLADSALRIPTAMDSVLLVQIAKHADMQSELVRDFAQSILVKIHVRPPLTADDAWLQYSDSDLCNWLELEDGFYVRQHFQEHLETLLDLNFF